MTSKGMWELNKNYNQDLVKIWKKECLLPLNDKTIGTFQNWDKIQTLSNNSAICF